MLLVRFPAFTVNSIQNTCRTTSENDDWMITLIWKEHVRINFWVWHWTMKSVGDPKSVKIRTKLAKSIAVLGKTQYIVRHKPLFILYSSLVLPFRSYCALIAHFAPCAYCLAVHLRVAHSRLFVGCPDSCTDTWVGRRVGAKYPSKQRGAHLK